MPKTYYKTSHTSLKANCYLFSFSNKWVSLFIGLIQLKKKSAFERALKHLCVKAVE